MRLALLLLLASAASLSASVADEVEWGLRSLPAPLALDHLREQVSKGSLEDRREALRLIADSRRFAARPVVIEASTRQDPEVAIDALRHLTALGPGLLAEDRDLRFVLGRAEPTVRFAAIECFSSWGERRFVPEIAALLGDPSPEVSTHAAEALVRLSGQRLGTERQDWLNWYEGDRQQAEARLKELREQFSDPDKAVDEPTVSTLASMRGRTSEAVDLLLPLLQHQDRRSVAAAVRTLRAIRPGILREIDPALLADLPGPPPAGGFQPEKTAPVVDRTASALAVRPAEDTGPSAFLVFAVVGGVAALAIWLILRRTPAGRVVGHGSRALAAIIGSTSGAMVVKLKGRRHADVTLPPGGGKDR